MLGPYKDTSYSHFGKHRQPRVHLPAGFYHRNLTRDEYDLAPE